MNNVKRKIVALFMIMVMALTVTTVAVTAKPANVTSTQGPAAPIPPSVSAAQGSSTKPKPPLWSAGARPERGPYAGIITATSSSSQGVRMAPSGMKSGMHQETGQRGNPSAGFLRHRQQPVRGVLIISMYLYAARTAPSMRGLPRMMGPPGPAGPLSAVRLLRYRTKRLLLESRPTRRLCRRHRRHAVA